MLGIEEYIKINAFKDAIQQLPFIDTEFPGFRHRVATQLENIFGYKYVLFGCIRNKQKKEMSNDVVMHNVDLLTTQYFLSSTAIANEVLSNDSNLFRFSSLPNYKKSVAYLDVLKRQGFSDFLIFFLSVLGAYCGYIVIFRDEKQKAFTQKDTEIIREIINYLGVAYHNYSSYLMIKANNNNFLSLANQYPVGIITMSDYTEAVHANDLALEYMQELGIKELKYFPLFFASYILTAIKFDMSILDKKRIVRYKNFLFSIVSTSASQSNNPDMPLRPYTEGGLVTSTTNTINHIYIIKDELTSMSDGQQSLLDYGFTNKEEQIVMNLLNGRNNSQIAEEMGISINTVRVHINSIYKKCGAQNRTEFLFKMNNAMKL